MANLDQNPKTAETETTGLLGGVPLARSLADSFRQAVARCEAAICSILSGNYPGKSPADSIMATRYAKKQANTLMIHDPEIGVEWQKFLDSPEARAALEYCARTDTTFKIAGGREWWYTGGNHQSRIAENAIVATAKGFMLQRFGAWNYGFDQDRPLDLQELVPDLLGSELREIVKSGTLSELCGAAFVSAQDLPGREWPERRRRLITTLPGDNAK